MRVSLFPFLPVLLCMMGAMIMILVLIAWDVREQVVNPAETQTMTEEEAEELCRKIIWQTEDAAFHSENYARAKEQTEIELADLQARLALAERETQKIKDELARLEQLAPQFDSQTSATPEEVEHIKRLLAQQRQQRVESEQELAKLREKAAEMNQSYAIVPYRNPDGTFRRPIYIECRDSKIIIQPEGIELVPGDFQALDQPDNPFNTALRGIRQYYVDTDQVVRGSEPYPLLIVRPSGVEMFSSAMQATGNWVKDFGYELVCEDWNVLYPEPNEELRIRVQQQLEDSRSRLSAYTIAQRMAEQQSGFGGNAPRFSVNHRGEVVQVGGGRGSEDAQKHLAANREQSRAVSVNPPVMGQEANPVSISVETVDKEESQIRQMEREIAQQVQKRQPTQPSQPLPPQLQLIQQMGQQQMQNSSEQPVIHGSVEVQGSPRIHQTQRSQNWGLQGATQYTTGISRYVQIRCEANHFVLPAQAGWTAERKIPIGDSVSTATDQLVQAIWEFQNSWGSAGENTHWRPILRVRVASGGEQRFRELQAVLRNSGLAMETL